MKELQSAFQRSLADGAIVTFDVPQSQEGDLPEVTLAKINAVLNELRSIGLASRQRSGVLLDEGGVLRQVKRAKASITTTDSAIVAAVAGYAIRVLGVVGLCGATASDLVFNSKPAGAGTAISPTLANDAKGGEVLPYCTAGWMQTTVGEGLSATSTQATGVQVLYILVPEYLADENGMVLTDEDGNALTA